MKVRSLSQLVDEQKAINANEGTGGLPKRWSYRHAAKWGAMVGLFTGAWALIQAARGGSGFDFERLTTVAILIIALRVPLWAAYFAIIAALRNLVVRIIWRRRPAG